jgi:hypothetical protein
MKSHLNIREEPIKINERTINTRWRTFSSESGFPSGACGSQQTWIQIKRTIFHSGSQSSDHSCPIIFRAIHSFPQNQAIDGLFGMVEGNEMRRQDSMANAS